MSLSRVAQRYVKPLLEIAIEQGAEKQILDNLASFDKVIRENRNLSLMLNSPIIYSDKKLKVLEELFKSSFHPLLIKFFGVVSTNVREEVLLILYTEYKSEYNKLKNIHEVKVISAGELNNQNMKEIETLCQQIYKNGTITIQHEIDSNLIGGFILQTENVQFDTSIATQLKQEIGRAHV